MSAALETVRAFSDTLANELAQAVREQDEATVEAFEEIANRLQSARQTFLDNLNNVETLFNAEVKKALDTRTRSMKENGAMFDKALEEITDVIMAVKARYA